MGSRIDDAQGERDNIDTMNDMGEVVEYKTYDKL